MRPIRSALHGLAGAGLVALVGGAVALGERFEEAATPVTPSGVTTTKLGVHTRLSDEVEAEKISRTLDMVAAMGATWIVDLFPWAYSEPARGHYDWHHADLVVRAAAVRHLRIVARLDLVPDWARPPGSSSRLLLPSSYGDYAEYVRQFVRRYRGQVDYAVIWNEPNTAFEWGFRRPNAAQYVDLLRVVYPRAKAANPAVQVVTAGLAPTLAQDALATNELLFLQQMYDAGARPYFDVLGAHAFGFTSPASAVPAQNRLVFQRVALERDVMARNDDTSKHVVITETGWNDAPRWTSAVRPAQRVAYSVEACRIAEGWSWLQAICFFEFRLPARENDVNDYFAFVQPDFTPRAVYDAVKSYAHADR